MRYKRHEHPVMFDPEGYTNLVLGTLGIEHGNEHVPVTVAFCTVGIEDLTETWRWGLRTMSDCILHDSEEGCAPAGSTAKQQ